MNKKYDDFMKWLENEIKVSKTASNRFVNENQPLLAEYHHGKMNEAEIALKRFREVTNQSSSGAVNHNAPQEQTEKEENNV